MEIWRKVWRDGLSPVLSTRGLAALRRALIEDDERLTQGSTCTPPPMNCTLNSPVEGACLIGWCAWRGDGLEKVGEVEEFFAHACFEADQRMGEPAVVRYLLGWFDDTPRDQMRRELLAEVDRSLKERFVEPAGQSLAVARA